MQGLTKMGKGFTRHINKLFLLSGLLLLTALLVSLAVAMQEQPGLDSGRADIVTIDGLKAFGPLERPPVIFLHDKHTEALAKEKKDCLACHLKGEKYLSLKYQRTEDTDKQAVMDTYHEGCISCHTEYRKQDKPSGPVTCGECHVQDKTVENIRAAIGLDKSLHYRHAKANENKCERCHHAYNPETKKLFYDKGKEGACLYCHKEKTGEPHRHSAGGSYGLPGLPPGSDGKEEGCGTNRLRRLPRSQRAGLHCQGGGDPRWSATSRISPW